MSYINIGIRRPLALGADALPMDVYLLILKSLRDVQALVKCKEVCKSFSALINDNKSLRYPQSLLQANLSSNTSAITTYDSHTLLTMLHTFLHDWDKLNFDLILKQKPVPMILLVTGGFVTTAHLSCIGEHYSTTVTICRLPSPNRGVEKDFWVMDFPFYTNILAFCPAQNLIASAKEDGVDYTIHLNRIRGGHRTEYEAHPDAVSPTLAFTLRNGIDDSDATRWPGKTIMKTYHRFLAVLVAVDELDPSQNQLKVWNWTHDPNPVLDLVGYILGYTFLSDMYIMLAVVQRISHQGLQLRLMVIDLSISSPAPYSEISEYDGFICAFVYPEILTDEQNFRVHLRSDRFPEAFHSPPSPSSSTEPLCGIFAESTDDHLIALTLDVNLGWNEEGEEVPGRRFLHFVLETTLLGFIRSYDYLHNLPSELREFDWDFWRDHTRMIQGDKMWLNSADPLNYPDDIVGLRFALLSEDGRKVRVYDFNRRPILGNMLLGYSDSETEDDSEPGYFRKVSHSQVTESSVCDLSGKSFEYPIHTSLSYRVAEYDIMGSVYRDLSMTVDGLVMTTCRGELRCFAVSSQFHRSDTYGEESDSGDSHTESQQGTDESGSETEYS